MKPTSEETQFVIVAIGRTYPIKGELKALGFKWNRQQKVWYLLCSLPQEHDEFRTRLNVNYLELGISFRHFEVTGNDWNEIH